MMEPAYTRQSNDLGLRLWPMLGGSAIWGILQLGVDAVCVVVVDVFLEKMLKVFLVQNDHVIE